MGKQAIQLLATNLSGGLKPSVPCMVKLATKLDDSRQQSLGGLSLMKTHEILFQTLSQADDYVSLGEQLAKELGVSRTSIWKAIRAWKRWGRHRIPKRRVIDWSQAIFCFLEVIASNTQLTVTLNEECHSTQLDAKLGMEAHKEGRALYLCQSPNLLERAALVATHYSPDQGGIYMSLHLKPNSHLRSSLLIPSWSQEPSIRL